MILKENHLPLRIGAAEKLASSSLREVEVDGADQGDDGVAVVRGW